LKRNIFALFVPELLNVQIILKLMLELYITNSKPIVVQLVEKATEPRMNC